MKSLAPLVVVALLITTAFSFPEQPSSTYVVDTEQSTVHWTGKKIGGQHNGAINV